MVTHITNHVYCVSHFIPPGGGLTRPHPTHNAVNAEPASCEEGLCLHPTKVGWESQDPMAVHPILEPLTQ